MVVNHYLLDRPAASAAYLLVRGWRQDPGSVLKSSMRPALGNSSRAGRFRVGGVPMILLDQYADAGDCPEGRPCLGMEAVYRGARDIGADLFSAAPATTPG
jgi:hypothetical protein